MYRTVKCEKFLMMSGQIPVKSGQIDIIEYMLIE